MDDPLFSFSFSAAGSARFEPCFVIGLPNAEFHVWRFLSYLFFFVLVIVRNIIGIDNVGRLGLTVFFGDHGAVEFGSGLNLLHQFFELIDGSIEETLCGG